MTGPISGAAPRTAIEQGWLEKSGANAADRRRDALVVKVEAAQATGFSPAERRAPVPAHDGGQADSSAGRRGGTARSGSRDAARDASADRRGGSPAVGDGPEAARQVFSPTPANASVTATATAPHALWAADRHGAETPQSDDTLSSVSHHAMKSAVAAYMAPQDRERFPPPPATRGLWV